VQQKKQQSKTHEISCTQEDRIKKMEECLIRIDEKLKVLDKLDEKVDAILDGGTNFGITSRLTKIETRQNVIWFVLLTIAVAVIGVFIKEIWPKIS